MHTLDSHSSRVAHTSASLGKLHPQSYFSSATTVAILPADAAESPPDKIDTALREVLSNNAKSPELLCQGLTLIRFSVSDAPLRANNAVCIASAAAATLLSDPVLSPAAAAAGAAALGPSAVSCHSYNIS